MNPMPKTNSLVHDVGQLSRTAHDRAPGDQSLPYKYRFATPTATGEWSALGAGAGGRLWQLKGDPYSFSGTAAPKGPVTRASRQGKV
jgi:hypothetical protein